MKYADSDAHEPSDASPRIVNGLTVRPRKKVNLWYYGICLLPDFAAMLVAVAMGMRWLLRHSDPADKEIDMPLEKITFKFDGVLWILMLAVSGLLWGVAGFPKFVGVAVCAGLLVIALLLFVWLKSKKLI